MYAVIARILFSAYWDLLWWILHCKNTILFWSVECSNSKGTVFYLMKTNFLFKYCMQWLQEYCFLHIGTFSDEFCIARILFCFEVLNVVIARVLFSTWWNIEWCIKTIFFSSIIWSDCKNTVLIFRIKQYYRTPKN